MTMQTWKREYYPVPAHKVETKEQAIEHSIKKWEGLTKEALEKHGINKEEEGNYIYYNLTTFNIDVDSCALCYLYLNGDNYNPCAGCPLYQSGNGCMRKNKNPYDEWVNNNNASLMVNALRALLTDKED